MVATPVTVETIPSIDPATGQVTANFERTPPLAVPQLMSKARAAQASWGRRSIEERCALIGVLQEKILEARDTLADVVVRESGKPRVEALFADVFVSLDTAEHFSKRGTDELRPETVRHHSTAAKAKSGRVYYEPLGVMGIISSWNYPLAIPFSQIIAAVAAGNAVLCKTSDFTPECGAQIEKLFRDAGFPTDLVTMLQGGGEVGQALIEARPDKVFFTGSVYTGKHVAEACARNLIPTVLELGGKDAMLVLRDADLECGLERRGVGQLHELRAGVSFGGKTLRGGASRRGIRPPLRGENTKASARAGSRKRHRRWPVDSSAARAAHERSDRGRRGTRRQSYLRRPPASGSGAEFLRAHGADGRGRVHATVPGRNVWADHGHSGGAQRGRSGTFAQTTRNSLWPQACGPGIRIAGRSIARQTARRDGDGQ